eukprot:782926_1
MAFFCFCLEDKSKQEAKKESLYKSELEQESDPLISEAKNYELKSICTEQKTNVCNDEDDNEEDNVEENKIITQLNILNNNEYKINSLKLCNLYNGAFLTFIKKYCSSQAMIDKLWEQLIDVRDIGYIEKANEIAQALAFMTMQYKQRMYQKKNKTKDKAKFSKTELLNETKHISVWIVRKYGKQRKRYSEDQPYFFVITKHKWQNNLYDWLNQYVKSQD